MGLVSEPQVAEPASDLRKVETAPRGKLQSHAAGLAFKEPRCSALTHRQPPASALERSAVTQPASTSTGIWRQPLNLDISSHQGTIQHSPTLARALTYLYTHLISSRLSTTTALHTIASAPAPNSPNRARNTCGTVPFQTLQTSNRPVISVRPATIPKATS